MLRNALTIVKEQVESRRALVRQRKITVLVFLLEKQNKMPNKLSFQADLFTLIVQKLLDKSFKSSRTKSVAIFLSYLPAENSDAMSIVSDERTSRLLEPVFTFQASSTEIYSSHARQKIESLLSRHTESSIIFRPNQLNSPKIRD